MIATHLLVSGAAALFVVGCATIVSGRSQQVTFDSTPDEAIVKLDGRKIGKTPITTTLQKESGQTLTFEKAGYETASMELSTEINPWFFGNIAIGGLVGSSTDAITGSVYRYGRDQYLVTLTPKGNARGMLEPAQRVKKFVLINFKELNKAAHTDRYYEAETFVSLAQMLNIDLSNKQRLSKLRDILRNTEDARDAVSKIQDRFLDSSQADPV